MIPSNGWRITPPEMRLTDSSSGFISGAVQQLRASALLRELLDGRVQREAVAFCRVPCSTCRAMRARVGARPSRTRWMAPCLMERLAVGDDAVRVDTLLNAQTGAHRARTVRVVE